MPASLAALTSLYAIDLRDNQLTGQIPGGFGQSSRLDDMYLQNNLFSGSLDPIFCVEGTSIPFVNLEADCKGSSAEVECTCCTLCCASDGTDCVEPTPAPVAMPTLPPAIGLARFDQLIGLLAQISDSSKFSDTTSPQYEAAWWLATTDGLQLDFSTEAFDIVAQRYILALLFFGLGGNGWESRKNFVSDIETCSWSDVTCNAEGLVIAVDLGSNDLAGSIPAELGFIPNMQELTLGTICCWTRQMKCADCLYIANGFLLSIYHDLQTQML